MLVKLSLPSLVREKVFVPFLSDGRRAGSGVNEKKGSGRCARGLLNRH